MPAANAAPGRRAARCALHGPRQRCGYPRWVPEDRDDWVAAMEEAKVLHPPLAPPTACSRCLRPLEADKRQWGTCYPCGHHHPHTLAGISAVTYGAAGTRPWDFFTTTKFEQTTADKLASFVNGIAAMLSATVESEQPSFSDGNANHIVVPLPSSHGLIRRCLDAIEVNGWPSLRVVGALIAAERPRQTGLDETSRREAAAGKYTASAAVADKHVLLVDDAYTSGYTIHDAARAVIAADAASVAAVVYARRIHPEAMAVYRAERGEDDGD